MGRIPELDGLRGIAALLVVVFHVVPRAAFIGWAGVDLFFVLSGYLITRIIIENASGPGFFRGFYIRRALRIWPIYYLCLAALVACGQGPRAALPYYFTYAQNVPLYWGGDSPGWPALTHTWSLAIEEQFYLVWPCLVVLVSPRRVLPLALACAGLSFAARSAGFHHWLLIAHADGLALGAALAALMHRAASAAPDCPRRALRPWAWAAGLGAVAALIAQAVVSHRMPLLRSWESGASPLELLAASLISFLLVSQAVCFTGHAILRPLRNRALCYLGRISYGIYLYHYIVQTYALPPLMERGITSGLVLLPIELALTLMVAAGSWHFVERPILRLKENFTYHSVRSRAAGPEDIAVAPALAPRA